MRDIDLNFLFKEKPTSIKILIEFDAKLIYILGEINMISIQFKFTRLNAYTSHAIGYGEMPFASRSGKVQKFDYRF